MLDVQSLTLEQSMDAITLYRKLCQGQSSPHGYFEATANNECFIISKPALILTAKDYKLEIKAMSELGQKLLLALTGTHCNRYQCLLPHMRANKQLCESEQMLAPSAFDMPRKLLELLPDDDSLPEAAKSLLGIVGFEAIQYFEKLNVSENDPLAFPDFVFMLPECFAYVQDSSVQLCAFGSTSEDIKQKLADMEQATCNEIEDKPLVNLDKIQVNTNKQRFISKIAKLKEKIYQGGLFQCVLARRFTLGLKDPLAAFMKLKTQNPSPYHFYLQLPEHTIFGASPETAVKVTKQDNQLTAILKPLAGTKRSNQKESLKHDPKEMAEHMMLVDLARNDLARISKPGSREVKELAKEINFNHITHIRSEVTGTLLDNLDAFHALQTCMPMGTLSGAPKIKAIETLTELEDERRGPYGGSIGLFRKDGTMDTAIVIRSCCVHKDLAHVTSGAGIVKKSNPSKEVSETELKAEKLLTILAGGYV